MQAGSEGKLFGSVTMQQVAGLLAEKGIEIDRRKMHVAEPIKTTGEHSVEVRLHRDLSATLKVQVVAGGTAAAPEQEDDNLDDSNFSGQPAGEPLQLHDDD
jgi:hypothetical protein